MEERARERDREAKTKKRNIRKLTGKWVLEKIFEALCSA